MFLKEREEDVDGLESVLSRERHVSTVVLQRGRSRLAKPKTPTHLSHHFTSGHDWRFLYSSKPEASSDRVIKQRMGWLRWIDGWVSVKWD